MMTTAHLATPALERLHAALAARVAQQELPGLVALVARGDDVHVECLGTTAVDGGAPMRRETLFRVASLTKPMLAAVTLMLIDDGTLALDAPLSRWLPELAAPRVLRRVDGPLDETDPVGRPLTVEDLLTMRMGTGTLLEPTFDPPFPITHRARELELVLGEPEPRTPHPPDVWLHHFASLPLMYQPGEVWQYNVSFLVLGVLVARAAGTSLDDVMRTRLFEPLGMAHTGFWRPAAETQGLPVYYVTDPVTGQPTERDNSPPELWQSPPIFPSGAAGLLSTADDLLAFGRLLLAGGLVGERRLLAAESVARMTANQLTPAQIASGGSLLGGGGWGYGVGVTMRPDDAWPVPGRYGWAGGYGTTWFNDPHRGLVAILLTQLSDILWNGTLTEFDALLGAV
jgi:CubicO group peptidase (beta-lactamase class C family)